MNIIKFVEKFPTDAICSEHCRKAREKGRCYLQEMQWYKTLLALGQGNVAIFGMVF